MSSLIRVVLIDSTLPIQPTVRSLLASANDVILIDETIDSFHPRRNLKEAPYDVMLLSVEGAIFTDNKYARRLNSASDYIRFYRK